MLFEVSLKNAKTAVVVVMVALGAVVLLFVRLRKFAIKHVSAKDKFTFVTYKFAKFDNVTNFHTRLLNLA
ncbi:hypothetical protein OFO26_05440 [Campylobacter sp. CN_EL2]|nr:MULTISPECIES: hypothetical protein [unclassified Campylobacter]MDA3082968.1 hypothetical protein [Campylobacter sp. CN_EL2]MDA3084452.1 hypothetical protein [Campylobacter sp. CN_NE1]MDA3087466.1 hypothetical protein [Campylobacter sp. CN_NA2]